MSMADREIKGEDYHIVYNDQTHTVSFMGIIRLQTTEEYAPLNAMLLSAYTAAGNGSLTIDFRELQFFNSSGINVINQFIIAIRKAGKGSVLVQGDQENYWQQRSLSNLTKLWPKVQVEVG